MTGEIPFHRPLARLQLNARGGIYNLQFSVTPPQGGEVKMEQKEREREKNGRKKEKTELREGNIISSSFMIYFFPPCGCRGF